MTAHTSSCKL